MPLLPDNVPTAAVRALGAVAGAAAVVGVGVAAARALRSAKTARLPADSEWRRVGRLAELHLFPIKSGQPVAADELTATEAGLRRGPLRDRVLVGVDRNGRFISGRSHPHLLHVRVVVVRRPGAADHDDDDDDDDLVFEFSSPRVPEALIVDPRALSGESLRRIVVWKTTVSAVDCGDQAAAWLRKAVVDPAVHGEATPGADLRLAFYPLEQSDRHYELETRGPGERGVYTDEGAYHLLTSSSVDALNARLSQPVSARNFRPNFLIDGSPAFDEDNWKWVRIGDTVVFRVTMPCGRCMMTTIDPETGIKSSDFEPLKTLRTFRQPNAEQKKLMGDDAPMLGVMLSIHRYGKITLGDDVFVAP